MIKNDRSWVNKIREQERLLRFESFSSDDALKAGLYAIEDAKANHERGITVLVVLDDLNVFYHAMAGTSLENEWWTQKKLRVSRRTGMSSMLAFLEFEYGIREKEPWFDNEGSYALCGGCFPITLTTGKTAGYIIVSGLVHDDDHQIAVNALAKLKDMDIPSIT